MTGSAVFWILAKAREKNAHILGSVVIEEGGKYYNRLLWANPDGALLTYDKKHLFRMSRGARSLLSGKPSSHR